MEVSMTKRRPCIRCASMCVEEPDIIINNEKLRCPCIECILFPVCSIEIGICEHLENTDPEERKTASG